jgi:hypothetical protein
MEWDQSQLPLIAAPDPGTPLTTLFVAARGPSRRNRSRQPVIVMREWQP